MSGTEIRVYARDALTDTHIDVVVGQRFRFEAVGRWTDAWKTCDAQGYDAWYLRPTRALWRLPSAPLFSLCGSVMGEPAASFVIGRSATVEMTASGRLMLFANDAALMYWNNRGVITVMVEPAA